ILNERGYLADCSVTPHVSWKQSIGDPTQRGGPDYSSFPELPYFVDLGDISKPGDSTLLEIPVTSRDMWPPLLRAITQNLGTKSLARRVLRHWFPEICWLDPIYYSVELTLRLVESTARDNRPCVQAFHSSEFMPDGSPRFPQKNDVEKLYDGLHEVFELAGKK